MLEAFLFALTVSIDALITGFSYGVSHIKIPLRSTFLLNFISTFMIALSFALGSFLKQYIHPKVLPIFCFAFLFLIGLIRLLDGLIKNYIKRKGTYQKEASFSFLNLRFILHVYSSPISADIDASKTLSLKESLSLGLALSLDGILIGVGASLTSISYLEILLLTFLMGLFLTLMGHFLGTKIERKLSFDPTFLGGILLLLLAFSKL